MSVALTMAFIAGVLCLFLLTIPVLLIRRPGGAELAALDEDDFFAAFRRRHRDLA